MRGSYRSGEGTWRALGLGKPGRRDTQGTYFMPCWASQLRGAEPFANSIDRLTCGECPLEWSVVYRTLPCGAFSPLDGTPGAVSRGRHV